MHFGVCGEKSEKLASTAKMTECKGALRFAPSLQKDSPTTRRNTAMVALQRDKRAVLETELAEAVAGGGRRDKHRPAARRGRVAQVRQLSVDNGHGEDTV